MGVGAVFGLIVSATCLGAIGSHLGSHSPGRFAAAGCAVLLGLSVFFLDSRELWHSRGNVGRNQKVAAITVPIAGTLVPVMLVLVHGTAWVVLGGIGLGMMFPFTIRTLRATVDDDYRARLYARS